MLPKKSILFLILWVASFRRELIRKICILLFRSDAVVVFDRILSVGRSVERSVRRVSARCSSYVDASPLFDYTARQIGDYALMPTTQHQGFLFTDRNTLRNIHKSHKKRRRTEPQKGIHTLICALLHKCTSGEVGTHTHAYVHLTFNWRRGLIN